MNKDIHVKIVGLFKNTNHLSPIELAILNSNNEELITLNETYVDVLRDNLNIGIRAQKYTGKNVDDLKELLVAIDNIKDDTIVSLEIKVPSRGLYTFYIDNDYTKILGSLKS